MEGVFWYYPGKIDPKLINEAKSRYIICSFSLSDNNMTLWSYYANGFRGICIGVKPGISFLPEEIVNIKYVKKDDFIDDVKIVNPASIALSLITRKLKSWRSEKEVRLLRRQNTSDNIKVGEIKSLLLGRNVSLENVNYIVDAIKVTDLVDGASGNFNIEVKIVAPNVTSDEYSSTECHKILSIKELIRDYQEYHKWRDNFSGTVF